MHLEQGDNHAALSQPAVESSDRDAVRSPSAEGRNPRGGERSLVLADRGSLTSELLTPKELAAKLKVCERTVYREQREGRIPGRLVRGKLRFSWPEVLRALPAAPVEISADMRRAAMGAPDLVMQLKRCVKPFGVRR